MVATQFVKTQFHKHAISRHYLYPTLAYRLLIANFHPLTDATDAPRRFSIGTKLQTTSSSAITHKHTHQSILPNIHPEHLYQIINDVDQYQKFLPYCLESRVLQTSECGTMMDAVLRVGLPGMSAFPGSSSSMLEESYVSRVRMLDAERLRAKNGRNQHPMWVVEAKSIRSQLFDSLKSRWQLTLADKNDSADRNTDSSNNPSTMPSCKVQFEVEIQVSNPIISFTLSQVLKNVAKKQVVAFEKRCRNVPFRARQSRFDDAGKDLRIL